MSPHRRDRAAQWGFTRQDRIGIFAVCAGYCFKPERRAKNHRAAGMEATLDESATSLLPSSEAQSPRSAARRAPAGARATASCCCLRPCASVPRSVITIVVGFVVVGAALTAAMVVADTLEGANGSSGDTGGASESWEKRFLYAGDVVSATSPAWTVLVCAIVLCIQQRSRRTLARLRRARRKRGVPFGLAAREDSMRKAAPIILPSFHSVLVLCVLVYPLVSAGRIAELFYILSHSASASAPNNTTTCAGSASSGAGSDDAAYKVEKAAIQIFSASIEMGMFVWLGMLFTRRSMGLAAVRRARNLGIGYAVVVACVRSTAGIVALRVLPTAENSVVYGGQALLAVVPAVVLLRRTVATRRAVIALPVLIITGLLTFVVCCVTLVVFSTTGTVGGSNSAVCMVPSMAAFYGALVALAQLRFCLPWTLYFVMLQDTRYWRGVGHQAAVNKGMLVTDSGVDALQPLLHGARATTDWLERRSRARSDRVAAHGLLHYVGHTSHGASTLSSELSPPGTLLSSPTGSPDGQRGQPLPWIEWEDIAIVGSIGSGATASIHVGKIGDEYVAVKVIQPEEIDVNAVELFIEEALWTTSLQNETTVQLRGLLLRPPDLGMVLELCHRGSLHNVLTQRWKVAAAGRGISGERSRVGFGSWVTGSSQLRTKPWEDTGAPIVWNWDTVLQVARDCVRCVVALHSTEPYPVIHRDIKSMNFLVTSDMVIKLSDFGLARSVAPDAQSDAGTRRDVEAAETGAAAAAGMQGIKGGSWMFTGMAGSALWMAPEVVTAKFGERASYGTPADVFSLSIVLWEVLTGSNPYPGLPTATVTRRVCSGELRPEIPRWCPVEYARILTAGWAQDPAERPSAAEMLRLLDECPSGRWHVPSGPEYMNLMPRVSAIAPSASDAAGLAPRSRRSSSGVSAVVGSRSIPSSASAPLSLTPREDSGIDLVDIRATIRE